MSRIFAITRSDGGIEIMKVEDHLFFAPLEVRQAHADAEAELEALQAQLEGATEGTRAHIVTNALVTIAKEKVDETREAVLAETPDPEVVVEREIAKWAQVSNFHLLSYREIHESDLDGLDRTYRGAWADDGKSIGMDIAKVRDMHRKILRRERMEPMTKLDIEAVRALEITDLDERERKLAKIAAAKQKLRDVPTHPDIEKAQTLEEVKALTLSKLVG